MQKRNTTLTILLLAAMALFLPEVVMASEGALETLDLTNHWVGYTSIVIFVIAYLFVMAEEFTHLRKSKPVILAAGIMWSLVAFVYVQSGDKHTAEAAIRHNILEYSELFLFLLVAMTYINSMEERRVFEALKVWLIKRGFGFRTLFWVTGTLAFFISPIADNLTTALIMCAVVLAVGSSSPKFVMLSCINIVVGANAGGAFSPFGDITTLMVWQKGVVDFAQFFDLFIPSVVNFVVPAAIMHFAVPDEKPTADTDMVIMKPGGIAIVVLFILTIVTAVSFHNFLHLPPVAGMMTGLAYLQFMGYYLKKTEQKRLSLEEGLPEAVEGGVGGFDVFKKIGRAEWDTLLFFYGVVLCVGALGLIGYLSMMSAVMYHDLGATTANVLVGILSAIVDNIPVMFAVLSMNPDMSHGQWLLVTLTAGVGGSLLSVGSAAGVALMGMARGKYTFFGHLKWMPAVAAGYAASIWVHMWVNADLF